MQPPPVALNPGFPSWILSGSVRENLQAVRDKFQDRKPWIRGYPYSCQNRYSRQVVDWILLVALMLLYTITESLAAAAKGGLLIPAISSSHQSQ